MRDLSVRSYKREKRPRVIILASNGTLFVLEPEACHIHDALHLCIKRAQKLQPICRIRRRAID
jgi:hypothetical protein